MNKYFLALLLAAGFTFVGFSGCTTSAPDQPLTAEEKQQKENLRTDRIAIIVKNTARDLVVYGNSQNPERTATATKIAIGALSAILGDTDGQVTPDKIREALTEAGFDKLDSPEVLLALSTLTTTYELFWAEYTNGQIQKYENVVKIAKALKSGIEQGQEAVSNPSV